MILARRTLLISLGFGVAAAACTDLREPVTPVTPHAPEVRASLAGGGTSIVYSNFGPAMAFDANTTDGWTINGNLGPGIGQQGIAEQFTPAADYSFAGAQVPLVLFSGTGGVHVILQADAGGLPGVVIEDMPLAGLASTPTVLAAVSTLHPVLRRATPYWLTLIAGADGLIAGWNWNAIGDVSAVTFAGTQGGSAAGPWAVGIASTRGAFEIDGTPLSGANPGGPYTGSEGTPVAFDGSASALSGGATLTYSWNFGDGSAAGSGATPSHTYADNGTYTVTLTVSDGTQSSTATTTATITNVAPQGSFLAAPDLDAAVLSTTVIEGTAIKLGFANQTDPSSVDAAAGFQYAFDCGKGAGYGAFSTTTRAACPTVDNEQRTVRGKIRDKDGGVTEYTTVVSVVNHNPHVVLSTTQGSTVAAGSPYQVSGTFTDPGVVDMPWSWKILWGDGTSSGGTTNTQGSAIVASHTYPAVGSYSIKMTVTDKDAGTGKSNSLGVQVVAPTGNFWTSVAPLPTPRGYVAAGVVNNIVYAVGGGGNGIFGTVEAYDPVANSWTARAPLPTPRAAAAAGVINGILYVVGGSNAGVLGTLEAYDPATNVWTAKAPMPTPRWGLAAGVVNGVLYAVGGVDQNGAYVSTVEAYDPSTNTWTTKASLPTPRGLLAAGVVNGILYAVGGGNGSGNLGTVEAYDPATDHWTARAPLPTPRGALAAGVVTGVIYAVGGSEQTGAQGTVEAYDPVGDAWSARASQPTPRFYLGAGVVNGVLYAIGGLDHLGNPSGVVEAYHP